MPYVQLNELTIHYKTSGDGPPLVLLHGMGNNSRSWRNQLDGLKDRYQIIAWDAPGYGKSSDPAKVIADFDQFSKILKQFLDKLKLDRVYLLGHSMGAVLALAFYSQFPRVVKGLILADGTRGGAAAEPEVNQSKLIKRLSAIDMLSPQEIAKQRAKELLSPHASEELKREAEEIYSEIRPLGYRSVAYSLYHADYTNQLSMVTVPTLVICGELDQVTPVSESKLIHEHIPNSEIVIIPDTGHLCYLEDPVQFNYHVLNFLNKLEKQAVAE